MKGHLTVVTGRKIMSPRLRRQNPLYPIRPQDELWSYTRKLWPKRDEVSNSYSQHNISQQVEKQAGKKLKKKTSLLTLLGKAKIKLYFTPFYP